MDFQQMMEKERLLDKRLKTCLHRTFMMNDAIREAEMKRQECDTSLNKKTKECAMPCHERTFAMSIKQIMKKMENRKKQKQIFLSDWSEIYTDLSELFEKIHSIPLKTKKRVSKKK